MCQVRGVGAGGIVSSSFCLLYKLFTLKLTRKQLIGLCTHTDSPYIRGIGLMYARSVVSTLTPGSFILICDCIILFLNMFYLLHVCFVFKDICQVSFSDILYASGSLYGLQCPVVNKNAALSMSMSVL